MSALTSKLTHGVSKLLLGNDVFISYSHRDAIDYAQSISNELTELGYTCHFDQDLSEPDQELPKDLVRGLERASMLLVICTPCAGKSVNIEKEIRLFKAKPGRPLVVIDVAEALSSADWRTLVEGAPSTPERSEAVATATPSESVVRRALSTARFMRRNARLRNVGTALLLIVAVLSAAALLAFNTAKNQGVVAAQQKQLADTAAQRAAMLEETKRRIDVELQEASDRLARAQQATEAAETAQKAAEKAAGLALDQAKALTTKTESVDLALAANQLGSTAPERALKLAVESMTRAPTLEAKAALIRAFAAFVPFRELKTAGYEPAVFNREGSVLALPSRDADVVLWSLPNHKPIQKGRFSVLHRPVGFLASGVLFVDQSEPSLWAFERGSSPAALEGISAGPGVSVVSPTGSLIAGVHDESRVWIATQEGRKIHDFEVPGLVTSVDTSKHRFSMAFLSDEKRLLIVAADGHLYLLDPGAERILAEGRLGDVPQGPLSMPAARDRFAIATEKPGGFEDHVEVWRIDPLERISDWSGKDHNPCLRGRSVSFSADGERMAVAHLHEGVRICTKYGSLVSKRHDLKDAGLAPTQLRFAAHGSRLVVQGLYGETRVYDAESAATLASLRTYGRDVDYALLSPNGNLVVTGLSGAGTRIWDLGRGVDDTATDELRERPKTDARLSQSLSPDGRTLVYASSTREVWRLDAELRPQRIDLARSGVIEENSMPAHVSWDATGVRFVVVPPKGAPALVDAKSWTATELPFVEKPERVATDSAGRFVAYNQLHGGLRVCDTSKLPARANAAPSTGTLCKRHINYDHYLYDLALSPDGRLLAALGSASLDETDLLVWDRVSGKVVLKVRGDKSQPRHVVFSALGRHLAATAENDGTLASWEITRSGNAWSFQQRPSIRDAGKTWDIAISADGRLLASWGLEDAVKLWDAETGALIRSIHGGVGHEGAAAFIGDTNQFVRLSGGLHKHACRACRPVAELLKEARRDLLAIPTTGN